MLLCQGMRMTPYLTGVWLGEDQIPNTIKTHGKREIEQSFHILLITSHSMVNIIGRTYVFNYGTKKYALSKTLTKLGQVQFKS